MLDLLLTNARIVDGTGNPGAKAASACATGASWPWVRPTICPKPGRCSTSEATSCAPASSTATAFGFEDNR